MAVVPEPVFDVHQIQGNILRGFDTASLALVGVRFGPVDAARRWLAGVLPRVSSLAAVHASRLARSAGADTTGEILLNIAFSARALENLGLDVARTDPLFRQPMGAVAGSLFDPLDAKGQPLDYVVGATWDTTPDTLLLLGASSADAADGAARELIAAAEDAGCTVMYRETGEMLPKEIEHFGFRDGISQVGPRGRLSDAEDDFLTPRLIAPGDPYFDLFGKPGQPLVWPGQFVFGYPSQLLDPLSPGPSADGGQQWMRNGSFLVLRRLRQDVAAFRAQMKATGDALGAQLGRTVTEDEGAAMIVGRWKDGTPVLLSPDGPDADLAGDEMRVNNFAYAQGTPDLVVAGSDGTRCLAATADDAMGQRCPHFSHVRKVNPRDLATDQGAPGNTLRLQMLRRGIPFGPLFSEDTKEVERGLLFMAYLTSLRNQFAVLNDIWVNNPDAPELVDEGHDLLIAQNAGRPRHAAYFDEAGVPRAHVTLSARAVVSTGGGFFFSPGFDCLRRLAAEEAPAGSQE